MVQHAHESISCQSYMLEFEDCNLETSLETLQTYIQIDMKKRSKKLNMV
jgi:hypothetical protein